MFTISCFSATMSRADFSDFATLIVECSDDPAFQLKSTCLMDPLKALP